MSKGLFRAAVLALAAVGAAAAAQPALHMTMPDMPGMHRHADRLGKVSFPTSCNRRAQAGMERGVALLHAFGYAEAQAQFERTAKDDPACAIASWGMAMTEYQEIWSQPDAAALQRGEADLAHARALSSRATPRERTYIAALGAFFDPPKATFQQRADAYQAKMDAVRAAYPGDVEAGAFDALAILASTPPTDLTLSHAHKALAILKPLFAAHPDHPGLAHYIIHACDTPALAGEGLAAARVYAKIAPASPHALHMPAHIFARLGLWREDIASNLASVAASTRAEKAHEPGAAHQLHADEFLVYAWLQTGQTAKAETLTMQMGRTGAKMLAMPGMDDMKDEGHFVDNELRVLYALETRQWMKLATMTPAKGTRPYEAFIVAWGQGIAAGHLRDPALAARALADFDRSFAAVKSSPYAAYENSLAIKRDEMLGWKAYAEHRPDGAFALRRAADRQDRLGQDEVDIPAREMLADLLALEGRPADALEEYGAALRLSPNRLNGLRSAADAAERAGLSSQARSLRRTAAQITADGEGA